MISCESMKAVTPIEIRVFFFFFFKNVSSLQKLDNIFVKFNYDFIGNFKKNRSLRKIVGDRHRDNASFAKKV